MKPWTGSRESVSGARDAAEPTPRQTQKLGSRVLGCRGQPRESRAGRGRAWNPGLPMEQRLVTWGWAQTAGGGRSEAKARQNAGVMSSTALGSSRGDFNREREGGRGRGKRHGLCHLLNYDHGTLHGPSPLPRHPFVWWRPREREMGACTKPTLSLGWSRPAESDWLSCRGRGPKPMAEAEGQLRRPRPRTDAEDRLQK